MKPTEDDAYSVLNTCMEREDEGTSAFPGMTYEQGVAAALRWCLGEGENPLED